MYHALSLSPPTDTNCFDPTILDERPHRGVAEADDLAGGLHRDCQRSCALRHVAGNALGMDCHSSRRLSTRRIMPGGNRYERLSARCRRRGVHCQQTSIFSVCRGFHRMYRHNAPNRSMFGSDAAEVAFANQVSCNTCTTVDGEESWGRRTETVSPISNAIKSSPTASGPL
jgi:hypothetical protein